MDLKLKAFVAAAHLVGIVVTLRQLYKPEFTQSDQIEAALVHLDTDEQQSLSRIGSMRAARLTSVH